MEMYRTELRAEAIYNPYNVYALCPKDIVFLKFFYVSVLKGLSKLDGCDELRDSIEKINFWIEKGYIPKEHFPDEFKEWYLTNKEGRL
jgi:hypothetical protein